MIVINSRKTSLWFDWWLDQGPLYRAYGPCPWFAAELEATDKVEKLIKDGSWHTGDNERQEEIVRAAQVISINEAEEDYLTFGADICRVWEAKKVVKLFITIGNTRGAKKLLWFPKHVPRFSFITWTVWLNRLPTLDCLRAWGVNVEGVCTLCNSQQESRDHLFFECNYASVVWREGVRRNCTVLNTVKWSKIMEYM